MIYLHTIYLYLHTSYIIYEHDHNCMSTLYIHNVRIPKAAKPKSKEPSSAKTGKGKQRSTAKSSPAWKPAESSPEDSPRAAAGSGNLRLAQR